MQASLQINWPELAIYVGVNLAIAGAIYGRLAERVRTHGEKIADLDEEQTRQWESMGKNAVMVGKLQGQLESHVRTNGHSHVKGSGT